MNTILTDDERNAVFLKACGFGASPGFDAALIQLTEAAVVAKLAQQALNDYDPLIEQSLAALIDLICPDLDSGDIVRDAQEAMRELNKRAAAPEAPAQASAVDEREAFDAWWEQFAAEHDDWRFADSDALRWAAWQARAALAQKGDAR